MIGIEVGSNNLRLIQWDGKIVRRCVEYPLPENIYVNSRISSFELLSECLQQAMREHKLSGREAAVIIPAAYHMMRRLHLPLMTVQQLEMNLPYEFRDFLNDDKDAYVFDYAVNEITEDENGAKMMDITAVAARKDIIESYRGLCRSAGLKMTVALPIEAAYSNYIRKFGDVQREYCIIDLGNSKTRVYFYRGSVHEATRIIDYGTKDVNQPVEAAVGANAEAIARDNINAMYNIIATDVRKAINFYSFNNRESEIHELYVCGSGVKYYDLIDAITQATQLEIRSISDVLPADFDRREDLSLFIQAFSAVLQ